MFESQKILGWKGPLKVNVPAVSRDIFLLNKLCRALSNLAVNVSRDGASTNSLANLFQCSVESQQS